MPISSPADAIEANVPVVWPGEAAPACDTPLGGGGALSPGLSPALWHWGPQSGDRCCLLIDHCSQSLSRLSFWIWWS